MDFGPRVHAKFAADARTHFGIRFIVPWETVARTKLFSNALRKTIRNVMIIEIISEILILFF